MSNLDNYMNFISDSKFPVGNNDDDLWFLFQDKMLLIKEDNRSITIPNFKDISNFIDTLEIEYHLGKLNGIECFCGEISSVIKIPDGLKLIPLRQSSSIIDIDLLGVAGRASQIIRIVPCPCWAGCLLQRKADGGNAAALCFRPVLYCLERL